MKIGLDWMVQKDIYQEYLRRLDARALLDHYGAENCTEQLNKDGSTEIIHSCLLDRVESHHSHGDQHPSAAMNLDKKVYCCYAGGWSGDAFHFVMKMEGKDAFAEALGTVGQFLEGVVAEGPALQAELDRLFTAPSAYTINLPAYDESILTSWRVPHPYWASRGITEAVIETLKLGYDPRERRVVFPHFIGGTLVGWQKRAIPGETSPEVPKYRSSPGFPKAESLYAHDLVDRTRPVLVVESPFSVAKALSLGLCNVVATFGAKVTEGQIALLKSYTPVLVWFDADPAGLAGERRLLEALYRHTACYRITPTPGTDLADIADLAEFTAYTARHTMPAHARLGEIDLAHKRRR